MERFDLAIIGGGLASARAVKSFREAGGEGSIVLLSKDSTLPYHRPPLSKRFLRGETDEEPLVEDDAFYADHGVEVRLETAVTSVDPRERVLTVDGDGLGFGKLLLASGAWPRRLLVPGHDVDGGPLTYSLTAPTGAVVDSSDGTVTWAPAASDIGVHTLTVRVSDGSAKVYLLPSEYERFAEPRLRWMLARESMARSSG
jgi:NADPH-dependent 2,4-dienoyl-CoA reductase/sulfur reductase-like enzyme